MHFYEGNRTLSIFTIAIGTVQCFGRQGPIYDNIDTPKSPSFEAGDAFFPPHPPTIFGTYVKFRGCNIAWEAATPVASN